MLNVLEKAPYPWWQLWKTVPFYFGNIKCAWQRVTKGYCYRDVYDLSQYYSELFSATLIELSKTTHGYPSDFEDMEPWRDYLVEMAKHFRAAGPDVQEDDYSKLKPEELIKVVMNESHTRELHFNKAIKMLQERFYDLWD